MDHKVHCYVGQCDRRSGAMNVDTFASHMVSEWCSWKYRKRMDVSVVDFMTILHFRFSV
jgi:hypothetical protein